MVQANEFGAATRLYLRGLEIEPTNGLAHFQLAETFVKLKDTGKARTYYINAIKYAQNPKDGAIAEDRLSRLK